MTSPDAPRHISCDVAIVGGGPSGVATASHLQHRKIDAVLFEEAPAVGNSWRCQYDRLRLHTLPRLSAIPGHPIPKRMGPWVAAADYAAYLEAVAARQHLRVHTGVSVLSIERTPNGWLLFTTQGVCKARCVVIATGMNRVPKLPLWPGHESFKGEVIHSSAYRNAHRFKGRRVLVVGVGNSGSEIACDLAEGGAEVSLSIRSGPNILPKTLFGLPVQIMGILFGSFPAPLMDQAAKALQRLSVGNLSKWGVPSPGRGLFTHAKRHRATPIIDSGLVASIKRGDLTVVPDVESLQRGSARLADGRVLEVDAIVAATGYTPSLESLLGSHVELDGHGLPSLSRSAELVQAPGLYLCGFVVSLSGILHEISMQAKRIAAAIDKSRKYQVTYGA